MQTLGIPATAPDQPTNGSVGVNVADLSIWGVEAEAVLQPSNNFTFTFTGAYTHEKVDRLAAPANTGFPPITASQITLPAPTFAGDAAVSWTLPFRPASGHVVLSSDVYMTSDFGGQFGVKLPGYVLTNARVDWNDIGGSSVDIGFFLRNALNERYFVAPIVLLSAFPTNVVYVGEQRTWGVEARFRF